MINRSLRNMLKTSVALAVLAGIVSAFGTGSALAGYNQGFEFTTTADFQNNLIFSSNPNQNWFIQNNSDSADLNFVWNITGTSLVPVNGFNAQAGTPGSYVWANYGSSSASSAGTVISNWFLTPTLQFGAGDTVSFWTRTAGANSSSPNTPSPYPDRMQVLLSTNGSSTNVGTSANAVGDFITPLGDINPTYAQTTLTSTGPDGYPITWTQYTYNIPVSNFQGRIGFRYFIQDTSIRANLIGLDSFSTTANLVPEPSSYVLMGLGLAGLAYRRRMARKSS